MSTAIRFLVLLVLAGTGLAAGWYLTTPTTAEVRPLEIVWTGEAGDSWALLPAYPAATDALVTYRVGGAPRIALDDPPQVRTLPDGSTGIVVRALSITPDPTSPDSWILVDIDGQNVDRAAVLVRSGEGVVSLPAEPCTAGTPAEATTDPACPECPMGEAKPGCCGRCATAAPLGKPAADGSGPECELPPIPEPAADACGLCPQGCVHAISPDEPLPVVESPSAE